MKMNFSQLWPTHWKRILCCWRQTGKVAWIRDKKKSDFHLCPRHRSATDDGFWKKAPILKSKWLLDISGRHRNSIEMLKPFFSWWKTRCYHDVTFIFQLPNGCHGSKNACLIAACQFYVRQWREFETFFNTFFFYELLFSRNSHEKTISALSIDNYLTWFLIGP